MKNEKRARFFKTYRSELSMLIVFLVFYIIMSFASPSFNTKSNVLSVLSQMSVTAILAIGQTFVIVSGGIDLSVGMIIGLSGMLGGMYMSRTQNLFVGILIILGVSVLVGFINGFLVGYLRIAAFIATLGTQVICNSLTYVCSDGNSASGFPPALGTVGNYKILDIRVYIIFMIVLYILMTWIMSSTKVGRFTYAIGSNKEATRLSGINVNWYTMLCYIISGLMCGLAAYGQYDSINGCGSDYRIRAGDGFHCRSSYWRCKYGWRKRNTSGNIYWCITVLLFKKCFKSAWNQSILAGLCNRSCNYCSCTG